MSRYTARTSDQRRMVFGFDPPLSEYFIQVYDSSGELAEDYNSSGMTMVPMPEPYNRPMSNSSIYEKVKELIDLSDFNKYKPQLDKMLLDLPF